MSVTITGIWRYPVKGLSAEPLDRVRLVVGRCVPQDRRFALARPAAAFDPQRPEWLPKTNFVMLMRDEKLARLRTRFEEQSGLFTVEQDGKAQLRARITDPAGKDEISAFFHEFLRESLDGPPRVVEAAGHSFSDARRRPHAMTGQYVSLINLASISALEAAMGAAVHPLRFRANVYFEGLPAWSELEWVGSEIRLGEARVRIVSPITRCAATTVNPATAERDLDIPAVLRKVFGHNFMGVYGEVVEGGEIAKGDPLIAP